MMNSNDSIVYGNVIVCLISFLLLLSSCCNNEDVSNEDKYKWFMYAWHHDYRAFFPNDSLELGIFDFDIQLELSEQINDTAKYRVRYIPYDTSLVGYSDKLLCNSLIVVSDKIEEVKCVFYVDYNASFKERKNEVLFLFKNYNFTFISGNLPKNTWLYKNAKNLKLIDVKEF